MKELIIFNNESAFFEHLDMLRSNGIRTVVISITNDKKFYVFKPGAQIKVSNCTPLNLQVYKSQYREYVKFLEYLDFFKS